MQRLLAITHARFSLIRFRSPLLTESRLLSLPVGTEMFHFPTFPPLTLCVQVRVTGLASSRVSPFGNPRITVWLSTPRGLSQIPTSFIGSWCQGIHRVPLKTWPQRCSRPLCSSQHTGGTRSAPATHTHQRMRYETRTRPNRPTTTTSPPPRKARPASGGRGTERFLRACARPFRTQQRARHPHPRTAHGPRPAPHHEGGRTVCTGEPTRTRRRQLIDVPPVSNPHRTSACDGATWTTPGPHPRSNASRRPVLPVLLRKEVIQPHLPVRLPCYDLVPIASPTFDGSSSYELGHRLRVLPTFVT